MLKLQYTKLQVYLMSCMTLGFSPQQNKLGLFQNRVLNSVLDSEKEENGERITLHNDELHNLYSLLHNVIE